MTRFNSYIFSSDPYQEFLLESVRPFKDADVTSNNYDFSSRAFLIQRCPSDFPGSKSMGLFQIHTGGES